MDRLITALAEQFARLHADSVQIVQTVPFAELFHRCEETNSLALSGGEQLLRSAGVVEQTFGGITANLWDHPFEWTQPESLNSRDKFLEYLNDVESTRRNGFQRFKCDDDLMKQVMAPAGETQLLPLLLDTLVRAAHYLGRARAAMDWQSARK
jgi:hypothetical protein